MSMQLYGPVATWSESREVRQPCGYVVWRSGRLDGHVVRQARGQRSLSRCRPSVSKEGPEALFPCGVGVQWVTGCRIPPSMWGVSCRGKAGGERLALPTWAPNPLSLGPPGSLCLASLRLPGLSSGLLLFKSPHGASPGHGCHHLLCHLCIPAATTPAPGIGASHLCRPVCCLHSPACRPTEAPLVAAGTTCFKQHTQRPDRWISPIPPIYRWISILSVENRQGSRAGAWSSSHIDLPS